MRSPVVSCLICGRPATTLLSFRDQPCVTSLGRLIETEADVWQCAECSHCQTTTTVDLEEYYASGYKTLTESKDEDDLYGIVDGNPRYRSEFQAMTLTAKLSALDIDPTELSILDYGCGKALTMRHFLDEHPVARVSLFDVSRDYEGFWNDFPTPVHQAFFEVPGDWEGTFDVVTSFFSLEHVPDPVSSLRSIARLLTEGGLVYLVIPNMYSANKADMVVVDHVHHFSEESLRTALQLAGFKVVELDSTTHSQAYVCVGRKVASNSSAHADAEAVATFVNAARILADYWRDFEARLHAFEHSLASPEATYTIIGAGVIGTFIAGRLSRPERLRGYIDSNTHKQAKGWLGRPVWAPASAPRGPSVAYLAALNSEQLATALPALLPDGVEATRAWRYESGPDRPAT